MQITGKLTEISGDFISVVAPGASRPIRLPVAVDQARALAQYLYQDIVVSIGPAVEPPAIARAADGPIITAAVALEAFLHQHPIQPGAAELASIVTRLTLAVEDLLQQLGKVRHDVGNIQHDVTNVRTDIDEIEDDLITKHKAEFEQQADIGLPPIVPALAEAWGATSTGGRAPARSVVEIGVDTQLNPTWIEPALAGAVPQGATTHDLVVVVMAADDTAPHQRLVPPYVFGSNQPSVPSDLRNNVWLLYRPRKDLNAADIVSLRDGVVALLRSMFTTTGGENDAARYFKVSSCALTADGYVVDGAVPILLDNPYADLWLVNEERMAIAMGYKKPRGITPDEETAALRSPAAALPEDDEEFFTDYSAWRDWPPLEAVLKYFGKPAVGSHLVRILTTWSGGDVQVLGPGEQAVMPPPGDGEYTARLPDSEVDKVIGRTFRGATDRVDPLAETPAADLITPANGGAIDEAGVELPTIDMPAASKPLRNGLVELPKIDTPDLVGAPNYWDGTGADPDKTMPAKPSKRVKRKR